MSKNSLNAVNSINILRSFSAHQMKKFETFLSADYFEIEDDAKRLFVLIKDKLDDMDFKGFKKEELLSAFSYKNSSLRTQEKQPIIFTSKTTTHLLAALEKFLMLQILEKETFTKNHLQLKAYAQQGLPTLFEKKSKKALYDLEKSGNYNHLFYLHNYHIYEAIYFHPHTNKFSVSIESQKKMLENLDAFFAIEKMRLGIEVIQRRKFVDETRDIFALQEVINFSKNHSAKHFKFYAGLMQLVEVKHFNKALFSTLSKYFKKENKFWSATDQRLLLQFLINYITFYINKGQKESIKNLLNLYKYGLDNNILLENNNTITDISFLNFVVLLANHDQSQKAENFIYNYNKYLSKSNKESVVLIARAYVDMIDKNFASAIRNLHLANEKSNYLKLYNRSLLLRCTFEEYLRNDDYKGILKPAIDSYLNLIHQHKTLAVERKNQYSNLGLQLKRLFQIRNRTKTNNKQRTFDLNQLFEFVQNPKHTFILRDWLLEKIKIVKEEGSPL